MKATTIKPQALRRISAVLVLALAALAANLVAAPSAQAAPLPQFWTACFSEEGGSDVNECDRPVGLDADPNTPGHVYVADLFNNRINEFDAWGAFVKSWGKGVRDGSFGPQTCGPGATPPSESCQAGIDGSAAGELSGPGALAVDSSGNVYVNEAGNNRVQKFQPNGQFLMAMGKDVVASGPGDASNDEVQELTIAAGEGSFVLTYNGFGEEFDAAAAGRGDLSAGSPTVTNVTTIGRPKKFAVGQTVVGEGVPAGTTIISVDADTLTLSAAATETGTKVFLDGTWPTEPLPYDASDTEVEAALNALGSIGGAGGSVDVTGGPGDPTGSPPYVVTFQGDLGGDDVPQLRLDRSELSGDAIGTTLRCASDADAPTIEFSWLRNGEPIPGAESPTYTTVVADEGSVIQCRVRTEVAGGGGAIQAATPAYVAPPGPATAPPVAGGVSLSQSGSLNVGGAGGATLTCKPGTWQSTSSFAYEWYRNGTKIVGAEASRYVVSAGDLATPALFQCAAIGSNAGGTATAKLSLDALTGPPGGSSNSGLTNPLPAFPVYELNPREVMEPPSYVRTTNQGGAAEVCTAAAGDVCKAGVPGSGAGEFDPPLGIAIDRNGTLGNAADDAVYVGGEDRIQIFDSGGNHTGDIPFSGAPAPEPGSVGALAVNQVGGDLYFAYASDTSNASNTGEAEQPDVHRVDPATGEVSDTLDVAIPTAVATAPDGSVYVFDRWAPEVSPGNKIQRVLKFDPAGALVEVAVQNKGPFQVDSDQFTHGSVNLATGSACFAGAGHHLYATNSGGGSVVHAEFTRAWGPVPDDLIGCPRPEVPPSILDQYAVFVNDDTATVRAKLDPHFWDDTAFYVQYATADCIDTEGWGGGCVVEEPAAPGTSLGAGVVTGEIETPDVVLAGLTPGTSYRYRFVAQSGGGGPVAGVGGTEAIEGAAAGFPTFPTGEPVETNCQNQTLRQGTPSEPLPDCRAYEQVSPADKNGFGVIPAPITASRDGEAASFASRGVFADAPAGAFPNGYGALRDAADWPIHPMNAPIDPISAVYTGSLYGASDDTKRSLVGTISALHPDAQAGEFNLYVHDSASGDYEFIGEVPGLDPTSDSRPQRQISFAGASADGSHIYFTVSGSYLLDSTPLPPPAANTNLYEYSGGQLKLVGVLPGGGLAPGSNVNSPIGISKPAARPVSTNGERVYWQGNGPLYLRDGAQSTLVSERESDSSAQNADFQFASAVGSFAFLTSSARLTPDASPSGTDLYRYDAAAEELEDLTPTGSSAAVSRVLGAGENGDYAYFIAGGNLAPGAIVGEDNLYAWHEGEGVRLIGRLGAGGIGEARVSANGRYFGFTFGGGIAGPHPQKGWPENPQTEQPFTQAYLYDHSADTLTCASCPAADGALHGEARFHGPELGTGELDVFTSDEGRSRNVSDAGELFFHTPSRLVRRDQNGEAGCPLVDLKLAILDPSEFSEPEQPACMDVYVYDGPEGTVRLLSGADDSGPAFFGDASADGKDAFIVTSSRLVGQDEDPYFDLYDARVEGGIAAQSAPEPVPCEGEGCRGAGSSPSNVPGAGSSRFEGPGNPPPPPPDCGRFSKQAQRKLAAAKKAARQGQAKRARKLRKQANNLSGRATRCNRRAAR